MRKKALTLKNIKKNKKTLKSVLFSLIYMFICFSCGPVMDPEEKNTIRMNEVD